MNQLRTPVRRRVAAAVATAGLAVGGLAAVAAPAQAAQTGAPVADSGDLTWEISKLLGVSRPGFPAPQGDKYVAPAAYANPLSSWASGSGTVAPTGAADLDFEGASVHWATTGNAWIRIADLGVEVDQAGVGEVTADVTYGTTTASSWATAAPVRTVQDLTIVDLSVDPGADDAGYPADYDALTYAFAATPTTYTWQNLRGRWSPELLAFVAGDSTATPAIPGYVYASTFQNGASTSGSTAGVSRYPAPISISVDRAVAATTVAVGPVTAAGSTLAITGTGFKQTFPGVYASLRAASEGDPAYAGGAVQDGAPTAWISEKDSDIGPDPETGAAASIDTDGAFSASIVLTPEVIEALDPTKVYTLVTRKGHGMGQIPANADQITESDAVDVSTLTAAAAARDLSDVLASVADSTVGTPATVVVAVSGGVSAPSGSVTVKNGETTVGTGELTDGTVAIPVSGLPVGETELSIEYAGSPDTWASVGTTTATVVKASAPTSITAPAASAYGRSATVVVDVAGATGDVTLTGAGAAQTVALAGGRASFALPAGLAPKAYELTASYGGDDTHRSSLATAALTVTKATPALKATWAKKPTARKAGKLAVVVSGPVTVAAPTGKVSVLLKKGGKTVKVAAKALASGKVVLAVKKLPVGTWKATVSYLGQGGFAAATRTVTVKVAKK